MTPALSPQLEEAMLEVSLVYPPSGRDPIAGYLTPATPPVAPATQLRSPRRRPGGLGTVRRTGAMEG